MGQTQPKRRIVLAYKGPRQKNGKRHSNYNESKRSTMRDRYLSRLGTVGSIEWRVTWRNRGGHEVYVKKIWTDTWDEALQWAEANEKKGLRTFIDEREV